MGKILIKDKDIVIPGEVLAEGMDYLPAGGAFREKDNIISSQVGLVSVSGRLIRVIPVSGKYIPKRGDNVIGKISHVGMSNWGVDIGYANDAMLVMKEATSEFIPRGADLTHYFNNGDYILCKITNVTKTKLIDVSMKGLGLRKLTEGRIIKVVSAKVPRIIGKAGSMIKMIKDLTDCRIIVGQNGVAWLNGMDPDKEALAVEAIRMIEENSHKTGLTDEVEKFLKSKLKKPASKVGGQNVQKKK